MCCKLAKGHSQVTELATELLFLRFQKRRILQKKRTHSPLTGAQGPSGSYPGSSICLGSCLPSCPSHMCPPMWPLQLPGHDLCVLPTQFLESFTGTGLPSAESAKTPSFWHLQGPEPQS